MAQKMFQRLYGNDVGLKVEDLETYAELLELSGFDVHGGRVIGAEAFDRVKQELKMSEMIVKSLIAPDWMQKLNYWNARCLLEKGAPYILRSSSRADRGGNGIYESLIFVPTGDSEADAKEIWRLERQMYEGEFRGSAIQWREKENLPIGMAIGIERVVGKARGNLFYPILSGVAYTSYRGKPLVTVRFGLGAGVQGEKAAKFTNEISYGDFIVEMSKQGRASVVDLQNGKQKYVDIEYLDIQMPINLFQRVNEIFERLAKLKEKGKQDFYLEWVLADINSQIQVVQIAPFEDKEGIPINIESTGKTLLASGPDIVNHGKKTCQQIVWAREPWNDDSLNQIAYLNTRLKDYLLIIPQEAFSLVSNIDLIKGQIFKKFEYKHFSNASAILENQVYYEDKGLLLSSGRFVTDHKENKGGTHFQQICDRRDVLFLGAKVDVMKLFDLEGGQDYGESIRVWEIETEAVNDYTKDMGYIFIKGKPKILEYSERQMVCIKGCSQ